MANILAVLDPDKKYVRKLTAFMAKQDHLPFEIQGFDSRVRLHTYMQEHKISILLLSEQWKEEDFCGMADLIVLLVEKRSDENLEAINSSFPAICKYQAGDLLCKKLLNICISMPLEEMVSVAQNKQQTCEIIGIYSPVKRSLQTSFALIYSRLRANNKKTLYLNFEVFSGFHAWFRKEYSTDLMDLMYFLKDDPERFLLKMAAMTEEFGNVKYIPPAYSYEDFMQVSAKQWEKLILTIAQKSDYEVLVLDLDDQMQGLFNILNLCTKIYTMTKPDGLAMAKIASYEEMLKMSGKASVLDKTVKCRLPAFKEIPQEVNALSYSQLADYMRNKLGEEFDG